MAHFIGGPLDGTHRNMGVLTREVWIPAAPPNVWTAIQAGPDDPMASTIWTASRYEVYRVRGSGAEDPVLLDYVGTELHPTE